MVGKYTTSTPADVDSVRTADGGSSESATKFLGAMSRELSGELSTIASHLELLKRQLQNEEQHELADIITDATQRLAITLTSSVDYARAVGGRVQPARSSFPLPQLIQEVVGVIGVDARQRGVTVNKQIASGLPTRLRGDRRLVGECLAHVLHNAVTHARSTVDFSVQYVSGELIALVVDDGDGVPDGAAEEAFQPFVTFEEDDARTRPGLGLAITRAFTHLMNGQVRIIPGRSLGTAVELRWPIEALDSWDAQEPRRMFGTDELLAQFIDPSSQPPPASTPMRAPYNSSTSAPPASQSPASQSPMSRPPVSRPPMSRPPMSRPPMSRPPVSTPPMSRPPVSRPPMSRPPASQSPNSVRGGSLNSRAPRSAAPRSAAPRSVGPRSAAPHSAAPHSAAPHSAAPHTHKPKSDTVFTHRVLVVDDDPQLRKTTLTVLNSMALPYDIAADGRDAMARLRGGDFTAVVIDMRLPVMDGFSTLYAIRQDPELEGLKVLALTSRELRHQQDDCFDAGCDLFQAKPVSFERLSRRISELLTLRRREEPAAQPGKSRTAVGANLPMMVQRYRASFPALEQLISKLSRRALQSDGEAMDTLRQLFERVSGTANSLALVDLSEACADANTTIRALQRAYPDPHQLPQEASQALDGAARKVRSMLQESMPIGGSRSTA